ncbi:hypothetical protein [Sphingomonas piscis]|uniref:hypothetical protein n=1 Tax=Sphingomonas piscis TaxID=2714943 RepID=UPI001FE372DE|nr:hypothetical protein [Sphingomonas piscis]
MKYKKCHRDRESKAEANPFADSAKMRTASKKGRCLHPDSGGGHCGSTAIGSHTVQKNGGLKAIAEEGHVLTTFVGFEDIQKANGAPEPKRMGVNDASTFPGFCNKHDTELFAPIEGSSLNLGPKEAFLFLYRSHCLELARKRVVVGHLPTFKKMDSGKPMQAQFAIQDGMRAYEQGLLLSLTSMEAEKNDMDGALLSENWADVHYCQVEFDGLLPLTTTCGFYPEFDWDGNDLQDLSDLSQPGLPLSFTITSFEGYSSAILVWRGPQDDLRKQFVTSFLGVSDAEKAGRIAAFAFEVSENTQIKPSWWVGLPSSVRERLIAKTAHGTIVAQPEASAMKDVAPLTSPLAVKSVLTSWA